MKNAPRAMAAIGLSCLAFMAIGNNRQAHGEETASALIEAAKADLAERLGVAKSEIGLVGKAEELTWPDTSLGCAEPRKMYAQVLTPGFRLTLGARDKRYDYHTGGGVVRLCRER